jgi:hypothetical protein
MPCSAVKDKRRFRGTCASTTSAGTVPPKRRLTFTEVTGRYNPEDRTLPSHRCENLKSYVAISLLNEIHLNNFIQIHSVRLSTHTVSLRSMDFRVVTPCNSDSLRSTRRRIPEESTLRSHRRKNAKSNGVFPLQGPTG